MRDAGDICYADVYKDGTGVVEYTKYDDMKYAVRKLDDTKFKSHEVNLFDRVHERERCYRTSLRLDARCEPHF
uniref:RRM domain-containing protein n=1 Tax=Parascaris equorum TaxID=6256 RepID=A0A914R476_PAREQ